MLRNNKNLLSSDLNNLLKRLDIDRDLKVSLSELKKLFNLQNNCLLSVSNSSSSFINKEKNKHSNEFNFTRYVSPRKGSPIKNSPKKLDDDYNRNLSLHDRTLRLLDKSEERFEYDRLRGGTKRDFSPKIQFSNTFFSRKNNRVENLISYEEENFINYVKVLLDLENEVERKKIDLTYKTDFNVEDVFKNFELEGRGYLTDVDVKFGLNAFDVFASKEEISLLMKRYDIHNEGIIRLIQNF